MTGTECSRNRPQSGHRDGQRGHRVLGDLMGRDLTGPGPLLYAGHHRLHEPASQAVRGGRRPGGGKSRIHMRQMAPYVVGMAEL